jgi:hypothetical protein
MEIKVRMMQAVLGSVEICKETALAAMVLFQGILDARRNRFCLAEAGTVYYG